MILTLDLETSSPTSFKRKSNPFDPRGEITSLGFKFDNEPAGAVLVQNVETWLEEFLTDHTSVIVGQNLKFDLLWLWKSPTLQEWLKRGGKVWDTQTVEWLLDGHDPKNSRDLDTLSKKYGGEVKYGPVSEWLKSGKYPKDYPDKEELLYYNRLDVENTYKVFKGQVLKARNQNQIKLIQTYMDHYLAVCEMEFNGIYIDQVSANILREQLESKVREVEKWLKDYGGFYVPNFNPTQNRHVSLLLFGGEYKERERKLLYDESGLPIVVKTKSSPNYGKQKEKWEEVTKSIYGLNISGVGFTKDKFGYYHVDEKALEKLLNHKLWTPERNFVERLLEFRELNKRLSTYYYVEKDEKSVGMLSLINPISKCIHPNFKTAQNVTGRLACGEPNMQNIPKEMYPILSSRFGNDGVMLSLDYSQLEVCIAAFLSQDRLLAEEIHNKEDLHTKNATFVYNCKLEDVSPEQRKRTKAMTFALLYGAHHTTMSEREKLPVEECEAFVDGFYKKYEGMSTWHKLLEAELNNGALPTQEPLMIKDKLLGQEVTQLGENLYKSYLLSPLGQRWVFRQKAVRTKKGGIFRYWPQTDMKNYPVQGTATTLVNLGVGKLYRALQPIRDYVKIINEIHDEVWLDVRKDRLPEVLRIIDETVGNVNNLYEERFGKKLEVPIRIEYGYGKTIEVAK